MKYYLEPYGGAEMVFTVLNPEGCPAYTVRAEASALRRLFLLVDGSGAVAAKIMCIRISSVFQYTVFADKKHVLVTVDTNSNKQPVKLKGVKWKFRGDVITRAFDMTDESGKVIMTHGRCWNMNGVCYAVDIQSDVCADTELCLGIAIAVDCTDPGRVASPIPTG